MSRQTKLQPATSASPASLAPRPSWRTRLPFFYGWVVVGSVFVAMAISYGVFYSFSVFFVALLEEYGWSRAAIAGVFSANVMVTGLMAPVAGRLTDRFGPSRIVPAGGILVALGMIGSARLTELWEFYLYFGVVCAVGICLAGAVPGFTMLSRWFSNRRALAIGLATSGIGLGIVVLAPLSQYLISNFGWRWAFLILGVTALLAIAPQAALLLVATPEQLGLKPDGATHTAADARAPAPRRVRELVVVDRRWATYPWSVATALRTARFWLLTGSLAFNVLTLQMLWAHQVVYLVDAGYDRVLAAFVAGLGGFVSMPAKVVWGAIADRLGREAALSLGTALVLLSMLLLVVAGAIPTTWLVLLYAVVYGMGYAVSAPVMPSAAADVFASRNFGTIYGAIFIGNGAGGAFGAWSAGYVFDVTGSYLVALAIGATTGVASVACMWLAAPRAVRRVMWRTRG